MLQALKAGKIISKDLLFKDVRPKTGPTRGEQVILDQVDWEISGDPYFYENRHTPPVPVSEAPQAGGEEHWIYYNTTKFSGKRLVVKPGQTFTSREQGVYNILVWRGKGRYDGYEIEGRQLWARRAAGLARRGDQPDHGREHGRRRPDDLQVLWAGHQSGRPV